MESIKGTKNYGQTYFESLQNFGNVSKIKTSYKNSFTETSDQQLYKDELENLFDAFKI